MDKKKIEHSKPLVDLLHGESTEGLSRRSALKMMGVGGAAAFMGMPPSSHAAQAEAGTLKSSKKAKILVVGAGAGGLMALSRLRRALPNADITVISPNETHLYQPGQIFMAAGLYTIDDIKKENKEFIPEGVKWIKDEVAAFDPDNNKVTTRAGEEVLYDFMMILWSLQQEWSTVMSGSKD